MQLIEPIINSLPTDLVKPICPAVAERLIDAIFCRLTGMSSALQALHIIAISLIATVFLLRTYVVKRRRRSSMKTKIIKKIEIKTNKGRLTSICASPEGWVVSGFSGDIIYISTDGRQIRTDKVGLGVVRSLCLSASGALLIGCDDGQLHAAVFLGSSYQRIYSFGISIYKIVWMGGDSYLAALGDGSIASFETQNNPGGCEFSFRLIKVTALLSGSAFDVVATHDGYRCVGVGGEIVAFENGRENRISVSSQTVWGIIHGTRGQFIVAINDGSISIANERAVQVSRIVHRGAVRSIESSPQGRWLVTAGKDRCVFATSNDLESSILLHKSADYVYQTCFDASFKKMAICDGAGTIILIDFGALIDSFSVAQLRNLVS